MLGGLDYNLGDICIESNYTTLDEVTVKATRPIFKSGKDGSFTFSTNRMLEYNTVANAWDLIDIIPFVQKNDNSYSIIGTPSTSITINGKLTSMSPEQLKEYLGTIDPQKIRRVDVYYNTPANHNVKGSSINIELERPRSNKLNAQWSIYASLYQCNTFFPVGGVSLMLSKKKWSLDLSYSVGTTNKEAVLSLDTNHKYNEQTSHVQFYSKIKPDKFSQMVKANFTLDLKKKRSLSIFYSGRFNVDKRNIYSNMSIDDIEEYSRQSTNKEHGNSYIQIFNADYNFKGFNVGCDYTFYMKDITQDITETVENESSSLEYDSYQKVNRGNVYFNNSNILKHGTLAYGANASIVCTENSQYSEVASASTGVSNYEQTQHEQYYNIFASWSQNFSERLNYTATINMQYFSSMVNRAGNKYLLWETVRVFPSLTLQYDIQKYKHKLQLDISSNDNYPTYAQLSPRRLYINSYCVEVGNPLLKPYQTYQFNLNYILNNKYIFGIMANTKPHFIVQQMIQSSNSLSIEYQPINFDRYTNIGVTTVIPVKVGNIINAKINGELYYVNHKANTEELEFDRSKIQGKFNISNNILINKAKTLGFQLSCTYETPSICGIYNVAHTWNLSAGFTFNPRRSGWKAILKVNDILNTSSEKINVHTDTQNYYSHSFHNSRIATLTVRYNIGWYKESKSKKIDTSRMQ